MVIVLLWPAMLGKYLHCKVEHIYKIGDSDDLYLMIPRTAFTQEKMNEIHWNSVPSVLDKL